MKKISIQDLKAQLSAFVAEAEAGQRIVITRHNEPAAQLMPVHSQYVHRGRRFGRGSLKPALHRATSGRYLSILLQDRGER